LTCTFDRAIASIELGCPALRAVWGFLAVTRRGCQSEPGQAGCWLLVSQGAARHGGPCRVLRPLHEACPGRSVTARAWIVPAVPMRLGPAPC